MKLIDQTPFFSEKGEITLIDRVKAMLRYGPDWISETQAQNTVVAILDKVLERGYTLIRNTTLPGLDIMFPFILVGPSGVYVMHVTNLRGTYRAKGNVWGSISGNTYKTTGFNLLTRTDRMARAVQVYLERHGYQSVIGVEAVLLCSDPGLHVDSLRPIIRVVMRDALERFAVSVYQAQPLLSPEAIHTIIDRITNPPTPHAQAASQETSPGAGEAASSLTPEPAAVTTREAYIPPFTTSRGKTSPASPADTREKPGALEDTVPKSSAPESVDAYRSNFNFNEETNPLSDIPIESLFEEKPSAASPAFPLSVRRAETGPRSQTTPKGFSRGQWALVVIFFLLEGATLAVFFFLIYSNIR